MAIDSKFLVLTKEALKTKVNNLDRSWTTILINGDLAYSTKGADAGLANNLCVNADLLKEIITGNLRYEAKAEDNFLLDGDYYTLKNINGVNVPYALKQVLDFIALLKKPYIVEFRNGSDIHDTLTIYWNSKVTKPTDPTKSGLTFTGWTPSWNFSTDTLNNKNQLIGGKLIFTAQWEEESATISYLTLTCNCTSIQEGNTCTFTAPKYHWSDGTETTATGVSWSSSNTSIATISNGVVTAVSAGTTTITASAGGYSDYCDVTITAAPIEEEYYYRFVNISNKAIDIYLDYWATWNSTLSARNGSANTGAISDSTYMLHIDTAPTSGYHWEISGPEGLYEYDETHGNTVYGSEDSSDPATYTISMVKDDTPSVEITCIEYSVTITAQDVAATATTANYSVTATKIIRYNNGTSSTQTIPASGYTVTGASFSANTDTTPKTKTISVSINNPDSNLCSDSVTTASTTFTLAAAGQDTEVAYSRYFLYDVNDISDSLVDTGKRLLFTYKSKRLDYNQAGQLLATYYGLDGSGNILTSMLINTPQYYYIIGHYTSDDSDHLLDNYIEKDEYDRTNYIFKPYLTINYPCLDSSGNNWNSTPSMAYNYKLRVLGPNSTEVDFYYGEDTTGELILAGNWKHFSGSMSAPDCSTPPTPVSATITYKPNGGSGLDVVDDVTVGLSTTTITNPFNRADEDVTQAWWQITGKSDFSATTSYTFDSWNTESDGSGTSYGENDSITPAGDTILYAIWNSEVTIEGEGEVSDTINGSPNVICTYDSGSENELNIYFEYQNSSILTSLENDVTLQATNIVNSIKQTLLKTGKGYNVETEIGQPELSGYIYIYWWGKDSSDNYYHSYGTTYTSLGKWEGTCPPTLTGGLYRLVAVITVRTDGTYEYSLYMNDNYAEVTATCPYSIKFNV